MSKRSLTSDSIATMDERTDVMDLMSTLVNYGLEDSNCKVSIKYYTDSGRFTISKIDEEGGGGGDAKEEHRNVNRKREKHPRTSVKRTISQEDEGKYKHQDKVNKYERSDSYNYQKKFKKGKGLTDIGDLELSSDDNCIGEDLIEINKHTIENKLFDFIEVNKNKNGEVAECKYISDAESRSKSKNWDEGYKNDHDNCVDGDDKGCGGGDDESGADDDGSDDVEEGSDDNDNDESVDEKDCHDKDVDNDSSDKEEGEEEEKDDNYYDDNNEDDAIDNKSNDNIHVDNNDNNDHSNILTTKEDEEYKDNNNYHLDDKNQNSNIANNSLGVQFDNAPSQSKMQNNTEDHNKLSIRAIINSDRITRSRSRIIKANNQNSDDISDTSSKITPRGKRAKRRQIIRKQGEPKHSQNSDLKHREQTRIDQVIPSEINNTQFVLSQDALGNELGNTEDKGDDGVKKTISLKNNINVGNIYHDKKNKIEMTTFNRSPIPKCNRTEEDCEQECRYKLGVGVLASNQDMIREFTQKLSKCENSSSSVNRHKNGWNRDETTSIGLYKLGFEIPGKNERQNSEPGNYPINKTMDSQLAEDLLPKNKLEDVQSTTSWYKNLHNGVNNMYKYVFGRYN